MASAKITELTDDNTCKLCNNCLAKYSCPRCNIIYCSLSCYQSDKHMECSENFYKTCVMNELSSVEDNKKNPKAKMLEILKRNNHNNELNNQNLDSDDDEECVDIAERLANVNLDDADSVWEKLTEDERQEFIAFLRSEDATKLVEPWKPWWLHYNTNLIEELDNKTNNYKILCPEIINHQIKNFKELSNKKPSDCVKYNLMNVLGAYVFTTRYFNGEHFDFSKEAITCLITISLNLKTNQNFNDFDTVIKSIEQQCINSEWILTDKENLALMTCDLEKILKGPNINEPKFYIFSALSDLQKLFQKALKVKECNKKSNFNKIFPNDYFPDVKLEGKEKIKNCLRKIDYFLSYVQEFWTVSVI